MISGSKLGGLPPPEHLWDLLAAAGVTPMLQSLIFDGFWLPSGVPLGSLFGYFLEKWITFLQAVLQVPSGRAPGSGLRGTYPKFSYLAYDNRQTIAIDSLEGLLYKVANWTA